MSNAIEVFVVFQDHGMDMLIKRLSEYTNVSVPDIIRNRAVMLGRYLAELTPPVETLSGPVLPDQNRLVDGGTLVARNLGRRAVQRDLKRVYIGARAIYKQLREKSAGDVGIAMAKKFWKAVKSNDIAEAKRIIQWSGIPAKSLEIAPWDGGSRHRRVQTKRGRVNKGNAPMIILDTKSLSAYSKKIQSHVGWTKAGWITAASQVSTKGLSQIRGWIKIHPAPGRGRDYTNDAVFPHVDLTNAVPWVSNTVSDRTLAGAHESFEHNLAKEIQIALGKLIAKAEAQKLRSK